MKNTVDATGQLCPLPLIRAQDFVRTATPGSEFVVYATDPGVFQDFPAWCRIHGHKLIDIVERAEEHVFEVTIEVGGYG